MNEKKKYSMNDTYVWAGQYYHITSRTFQWYITEKMIPQANIREGKEAYYDEEGVRILTCHLNIIRDLKLIPLSSDHLIKISVARIRRIIKNYKEEIEKLDILIESLFREAPLRIWKDDYWEKVRRYGKGIPDESELNKENVEVYRRILDKLNNNVKLDKIFVIDTIEEVEKEMSKK